MISRRRLVQDAGVAGLGLLAGCGRLPWQAQPPPRVPRIGFLRGSEGDGGYAALEQGLQELGYVEGHSILIERRGAPGQPARPPELVGRLPPPPPALLALRGPAAT